MTKDQLIIYKICKIRSDWAYEYISKFIKGETEECRYFDKLKPLFDEFGYQETIKSILEIDKLEHPSEVNNE